MGFDDALFPRFRRRHDPHAARFAAHPFLEGITLEAAGPRAFRAFATSADGPFLPFAQGGFGTPSGKCEFDAETLDYQPPIESRLGDPSLARVFRWN